MKTPNAARWRRKPPGVSPAASSGRPPRAAPAPCAPNVSRPDINTAPSSWAPITTCCSSADRNKRLSRSNNVCGIATPSRAPKVSWSAPTVCATHAIAGSRKPASKLFHRRGLQHQTVVASAGLGIGTKRRGRNPEPAAGNGNGLSGARPGRQKRSRALLEHGSSSHDWSLALELNILLLSPIANIRISKLCSLQNPKQCR